MNNHNEMKNILLFLRKNIKIILGPAVVMFLVFLLFSIVDNVRSPLEEDYEESSTHREEQLQNFSSYDIEDLTEEELEEYKSLLHEEGFYFRVYIEHPNAGAFTSSYVIEEIIKKDEVLDLVTSITEMEFTDISPELAIQVSSINNSVIHNVQVSTNDIEFDRVIAEAYLTIINNQEIDFFNDRRVYVLDNQVIPVNVEETDLIEDSPSLADSDLSVVDRFLFALIGLILGLVIGVLLAFAKVKTNNEIGEFYKIKQSDDDLIIDYSGLSLNEYLQNILHAVYYPASNRKAIISENSLPKSLEENFKKSNISIANDISSLENDVLYDEIIIVIEKNVTGKDWYNLQRKQLNIYDETIIKILIY